MAKAKQVSYEAARKRHERAKGRHGKLKEARRNLRGIVDEETLQRIVADEQEAKKEVEAARAQLKRARVRHEDTAAAAMKTWMGGEFLAIAGADWRDIDSKKWSAAMLKAAPVLLEMSRADEPMSVDEAYELNQEWQAAIRAGLADRRTGEIAEPEPEDFIDGVDPGVDPEWREHEGYTNEDYAATNCWACPECGRRLDGKNAMSVMRSLDDPPLCHSEACSGHHVEMEPLPPVL